MNNIGRILWNLPVSLRKLFKMLENNSKILINKEWPYKFNEICLNEYSNISTFKRQTN